MNIYATYLTTNKSPSFVFNTVKEPVSSDIREILVYTLIALETGSFTVLTTKLESLFVVKYVVYTFIQVHSQLSISTQLQQISVLQFI